MQAPPVLPIDVTAVVAIIMVFSPILIFALGLTARFALKPTVEAINHFLEARGRDEAVNILERRVALLEQQVEILESQSRELREVTEFHDELGRSKVERELPPGPTPAEPGGIAPPGDRRE